MHLHPKDSVHVCAVIKKNRHVFLSVLYTRFSNSYSFIDIVQNAFLQSQPLLSSVAYLFKLFSSSRIPVLFE